jgi:hypothetical protein
MNLEERLCLLQVIIRAGLENVTQPNQDPKPTDEIAVVTDPATLPLWHAVLEEEFAKVDGD